MELRRSFARLRARPIYNWIGTCAYSGRASSRRSQHYAQIRFRLTRTAPARKLGADGLASGTSDHVGVGPRAEQADDLGPEDSESSAGASHDWRSLLVRPRPDPKILLPDLTKALHQVAAPGPVFAACRRCVRVSLYR